MNTHDGYNLALATIITLALIALPLVILILIRLRASLPQHRSSRAHRTSLSSVEPGTTCTTTIFLGSGGHTAEMLQLVSGLDPQKYTPRHYVVGWDDEASVEKVHHLETSRGQPCLTFPIDQNTSPGSRATEQEGYTIHRIPRSRHVGQSFLTTPFTLLKSLSVAMPMIKRLTCLSRKDVAPGSTRTGSTGHGKKTVLLMNGPGTCLALALAVIGARMAGMPDAQTPALVFIESFARVGTLSLAGKLVYPLCDYFLVQWPGLQKKYPRAEYIGVLV
ncbi:UDP-N-acetylglucosamine transferase subunit [Podila epicladia]|nr:UDP-N-acetylglucosamine transferase subunit [Podila epicladia]KAG0100841.1 UDP-N-acetylglucosamine transferase subunit [Podila epicladia]